jgi:hypothetical protein
MSVDALQSAIRMAYTGQRPLAAGTTGRTDNALETATPTKPVPWPLLPSPSAPAAPAPNVPSFSPGGNDGGGVRGLLTILTPQTRLTPPSAAGQRESDQLVSAGGRTPGLPVTSPD